MEAEKAKEIESPISQPDSKDTTDTSEDVAEKHTEDATTSDVAVTAVTADSIADITNTAESTDSLEVQSPSSETDNKTVDENSPIPGNVASETPGAIESTSQSTEFELEDDINNTSDIGSGFEAGPGSDSSAFNYSDSDRDESPQHDSNDEEKEERKDEPASHEDIQTVQREGGDGMERAETPPPQRKVDDDEDKNNPQYIPKRGTFYEHDYRTTEDIPDEEKNDAETEKADGGAEGKKKMWHDKREIWTHDKFKDEDQLPKSRDELIAIYGYDIRNEDGPPRARRRRRYGRGPNKYTRNWEDEDAYYKTSVKKVPAQPQETALPPTKATPKLNRQPQAHAQDTPARGGQIRAATTAGTGRTVRPYRDYSSSDYKSFTKSRNYNRGSAHEQQQQQYQQEPRQRSYESSTPHHRPSHQQTAPAGGRPNRNHPNNRDMHQLDIGMGSLSLQQQQNRDSNNHRPERKPAPKRYSSLRQITLPDSTAEPRERAIGSVMPLQQQHYYGGNEYSNNQQGQQQPAQPPPALQQPPPQQMVGMRQPPQLGMPPTTASALLRQQQFATPPQFALGPHAPPPQFLPPINQAQAPPINLNYQLPPQHYYQHQQPPPPPFVAQHQVQVAAMPQTSEQLFQPQGGITYYSPEEQQTTQRHAPPMRPKAAIPILPPPPTPPPINSNSSDTTS